MKALIIFLVCLSVITAEKVCTKIDVFRLATPCLQISRLAGMSGSGEENCRKIQYAAKCYTNALNECKKDEEFKLLLENSIIDRLQNMRKECTTKYGVITSEKGCSQMDVMPCLQIIMQGGNPHTDENICRSGKLQKVEECFTNVLKRCDKDDDFKLLVKKFGIDQYQELIAKCEATYVVDECNPDGVIQCALARSGEFKEIERQHKSGNLDVNAVLNLVCGVKECFKFVETCSSNPPNSIVPMLFVVKDAVDFLCDGEGRQALLDLEPCFKEGPLAEFDQCYSDAEKAFVDDVCVSVSPFEEQINRCAGEHLLNAPSCGEQAVQSIQLLTARLSVYIEDICTKEKVYRPVHKKVVDECNPQGVEQCAYPHIGELRVIESQRKSGNLDVNTVLNLACGVKECFAFIEKCSSNPPHGYVSILFAVEDVVDFLCDGEGRQALLDLETCFKEGPMAEFDQCYLDAEKAFVDDVCVSVSPFEEQINRCAGEHLLNSPSCGEQAVQSIQLLTARLSVYIEDICTKVNVYRPVHKRGLALMDVRGIFQTLHEEMGYNHLLRW